MSDAPRMTAVRRALSRAGWSAVELDAASDLRTIIPLLRSPAPGHGRFTIDRLSPKRPEQARAGTMSACFGLGAFPLHTDRAHWPIPPRFLLLRSVGAETDRPTTLYDVLRLRARATFWRDLRRARWMIGGRQGFLCPLLSEGHAFRYDPLCMHPHDALAVGVEDELRRCLESEAPEHFMWTEGRVLIIDNWRVLHGRGTSAREDFGRILERVIVP